MEKITMEDRETIAQYLENVAAKVRDEEGRPIGFKTKTERPVEVDTKHMRLRHTGRYSFKCEIEIQFPEGDWMNYGGGNEDAGAE